MIPGCIEHAYSISSTMQETKNRIENLSVIWLDLKMPMVQYLIA